MRIRIFNYGHLRISILADINAFEGTYEYARHLLPAYGFKLSLFRVFTLILFCCSIFQLQLKDALKKQRRTPFKYVVTAGGQLVAHEADSLTSFRSIGRWKSK